MGNLKLFIILAIVASFVFVEANAQSSQGDTKYVLRVRSDPNVLFISGGGTYDEGTSVSLQPAPETWREYTFIGWKIDGIWTNENPLTIQMNRNHEALAVYEKSVGGEILIDTIPRIAEITVDGTIYLPSELPLSIDWDTDSEHFISVPETVKENPNTRYVFDSWKDNHPSNTRSIIVNSDDTNFIALFKTQHFLKPITEHGNVLGGGWQDEGSYAQFEVESEIVIDKKDENIRYIFNSWNLGDYLNSGSNSVDIESPTTIKASWDEQFKLQLKSNVPGYDLFGTGWYDDERQVALIAETELESDDADTRFAFERWVSKGPNPVIIPNAHSPSTTITVTEPYIIEAHYAKSFRVNVWTPYGSTEGDGFYKEGEVATIKMINPEVVVQPGKVKKMFTGWDTHGGRTMNLEELQDFDLASVGVAGNQNLLLFVDKPANVTTNWKTQFFLDVQSASSKTKGSGWYDLGRMVPISVSVPSNPPGLWTSYTFDRWTGDIDSTSQNERIIMNQPKTVIAEWNNDSSPGIINSIILAAVGGIAILVYSKTQKGNFGRKNKNNENKSQSFEKFFTIRKKVIDDKTPSFVEKKSSVSSILSWLLGRDG